MPELVSGHMIALEMKSNGEKRRWDIVTTAHKNEIGPVGWDRFWGEYCWFPRSGTVFSADCLRRLANFLDEVNWEHRQTLNRRP